MYTKGTEKIESLRVGPPEQVLCLNIEVSETVLEKQTFLPKHISST